MCQFQSRMTTLINGKSESILAHFQTQKHNNMKMDSYISNQSHFYRWLVPKKERNGDGFMSHP